MLRSLVAISLLLLPTALVAQIRPIGPKPPPMLALPPSGPQRQPLAAGPTLPAGSFRVVFDPAVQKEPFTGRVYVAAMLKGPWVEPRYMVDEWFDTPQIFSKDVKDVPPGGSVTVDADWLWYPSPLGEAKSGEWCLVQAIARRNTEQPQVGAEGNLYSKHAKVSFGHGETQTLDLKLSEVWEPRRAVKESGQIKLVDIVSPSLSAFYGREVHLRAGVALPVGWSDDAGKHYPTVYLLGGYGRTEADVEVAPRLPPRDSVFRDVIWVVPDPSTPLGNSAFVDSDNNGPRERAFLGELVPAVESRFHGAGDGSRRYLLGIFTGGWSALWIQAHHPDEFAGAWAHAPDPVDFHDFQGIDLCAPGANMYKDGQGNRRVFGFINEKSRVFYDDFARFDTVIGRGGEIGSWEAAFGPRGKDGAPAGLFDRATGAVNPEVAKAWARYDLAQYLETNWGAVGPKLKGKLHAYDGEQDNFYYNRSLERLKDELQKLGAEADIRILPKQAHALYRPGVGEMLRVIGEREGATAPPPPLVVPERK